MNNDSPPTSLALPNDGNATASSSEAMAEGVPTVEDTQPSKKRLQATKCFTFLDELIRNLDIIIYCELSILYYMDNAFLQLVIRALPQFFYFTPKSAAFPSPPTNRPYLLVIFLTNLICFLSHAISSAPEAGEAMRGYLHGGALTDFVGVKGPISKIRLVGMDLLVWALQIGCLAMVMERRGIRDGPGVRGGNRVAETPVVQDIEAEEQGRRRSAETNDMEEGIELQSLQASSAAAPTDESFEDVTAVRSDHPLDIFATGEHIIADLHLLETIRVSWSYVNIPVTTPTTGSTTGVVSNGTSRTITYEGQQIQITMNGTNVEFRRPTQ